MPLDFGIGNTLFTSNDLLSTHTRSFTVIGPDFSFDSSSTITKGIIQLSGSNAVEASLTLPEDVTINKMTVYGRKASGTNTCRVIFHRKLKNLLATGEEDIATINMTTEAEYSTVLTLEEIDNDKFVYYVEFVVGPSTTGQLSYVKIDFTL